MEITKLFLSLLCLLIGCILGIVIRFIYGKVKLTSAENEAKRRLNEIAKDAEIKKNELILSGRDQIAKERIEFDKEVRLTRSELQNMEHRYQVKEENLEKKQNDIELFKQTLLKKEQELEDKNRNFKQQEEDLQAEKERIIGLTREQVKEEIIKSMYDDARRSAYSMVKKIEEEAILEGEKKAQHILLECMQRLSSEVSGNSMAISTVNLPSDDMKGRIIGKEGRNIRTIELLTGTDIIVDDTPDAVVVSCFDPVRKEIAKKTLELLVTDGRIHPGRIEDVVAKVTQEIKRVMMDEGEKVALELGFNSFSPAMIKNLGRLYFRYSYSQNILSHSRECAILAGMIASEIGANSELAMRGALLHDIGKGAETESYDGHAIYGAKIAKDLGEKEEVVNAIASHHDDVAPMCIESVIVKIADAISASRPGARNDNIENYIKRIQSLENIALSFEGVEKAFAIQAGREIRVIVNNSKVSDDKAHEIAKNIATRIEKELNYPGKIRVTLVRETRVIEFAC